MGYNVYTTHGYGFDVNSVVDSLDDKNQETLNELIRSFWSSEKPYGSNTPGNIDMYLQDGKIHDITSLKSIFAEYECADGSSYGLPALTAEIFSWLWNKAGHDASIVTIIENESVDDHTIWMLSTVYPWHQPEFKSEEETRNAIQHVMPFNVNPDKISVTVGS